MPQAPAWHAQERVAQTAAAVALGILAAFLYAALISHVLSRSVFEPLADRSPNAIVVTTLGILLVLSEASRAGYQRIVLDTLPSMSEAIGLYRHLGFEPIAAYYPNPVAGALFLGKELASS